MSQEQVSHSALAARTANELLERMNSQKAMCREKEGDTDPSKLVNDSLLHNIPDSLSDGSGPLLIPKVSLGPMRSDGQRKTPAVPHHHNFDPPKNMDFLRKEMDTQEKIIVTLQRDNEALLRDKKEIAAQCKELLIKYEHLEAKHSLLLSAQQGSDSRTQLRVANDAAKIARLQEQVRELQSALDAEKQKHIVPSVDVSSSVQPASTILPDVASRIAHCEMADRDLEHVSLDATSPVSGDHVSRLCEYERMHEIQKTTINQLHEVITKLESEKKALEDLQQEHARKIEDLTKRLHELERIVAAKKESIGELLRTCQDSAVQVQRLKKQESRIRSLEDALRDKDDFAQKAMERLRCETKEVCKRYQERIGALEKRLELPQDDAEMRDRLATMEAENAELRRALAAANASPVLSEEKSLTTENATAQRREAKTVVEQERENSEPAAQKDSKLLHLEAQLSEAVAETAKYKEVAAGLQTELASVRSEWDAQLREVKRNFASQLQTMRSSHNEELDRLESGHRAEMLALSNQKQNDGADGFSAKLIRLVEKKGYDASLVAICERLSYLEKRSLHKEEAMAYELSEVRRMAEMEKRILREKADLLLEQKNMQIRSFRLQLDELLTEIAVLQATT
jgi:chromosome segregation ATPase